GTLLSMYARHGTDQFFAYRQSNSTNPVAATNWSAEQTIAPTGAGLTYVNPFQLSAENGQVYDFSRDLNFNPTVFTSTNGGGTWSAPQLFIKTGTGSIRPYVKYVSDYTQRIDFLYTDGHPRDLTNSLYHLYYQSNGLYKTEGTFLKSFTNLPVLHDSGERGSVIYQYSDAPSSDPNDHIATGRAWCWEITYQTNGWPVCVFTVQLDRVTGTNWFDDRIYYYYARWTGTNWQKRFIAQAGRPLFNPENDYAGGICLDPANPNTIYISSNAGDPFNLTSVTNVPLNANQRYELWRGTTTDGGLTFTWSSITTNSTKDNLRPYIPRWQTNTPPAVIWFRGIYTTFNSYDCEIVGLFNNPIQTAPQTTLISPAAKSVNFTNLSNQLLLTATATDDGLPAPLTYSWTTASGPTNIVFSDPFSTNTTAFFPAPGSYIVRFSASDSVSADSVDVTVNAGPPAADAADPSRVLWLKLDESSGTVASDSSGTANNGTLSGGATWQPTNGLRNGAIKLDGTNGLVTIADSSALDNTAAFTLAYWMKADAYPGDSAGLVCKRVNINTDNAYTTYLKAADKRIYVDIDSSNNRFSSTTLIQTGVWYHVALVFDGSLPSSQRAALYINGVLDTTATESSSVIPDYSSGVMLGNTHVGAANWFKGMLDEVRFYRRALSSGEVLALTSPNFAPSIIAGPIGAATNGSSSSISGRVVDDGKGGTLTAHWSQVTGPGTASFANNNLVATSVSFNRSGNYVLRLSGSDSQAEMSADLPVTVQPNFNIYEDWITQFFPGTSDPAIIGSDADPDSDGAANLLEFALGMNPTNSDAVPFATNHPGLPIGALRAFNGTNYLSFAVQRPKGRIGIVYGAQVASDLASWIDAVQAGPPVDNGDGTETVYFRDTVSSSQASQRFIRFFVH
ncbi:MAG TPA: LamG-like jellyroll fold domain-containing protein, partial [Candidatus Dormibacteraeota bacterium]|nr:LamG-like jellyroll fold domain-containing protein [Candidatus Dormibacteraeota bacterium]